MRDADFAGSAFMLVPMGMPFVLTAPENVKAFKSLALSQRRLSHKYRRWAAESTTELERDKWAAEADDYWERAKWHLGKAREWSMI